MKKITLTLFFLATAIGYSQNLISNGTFDTDTGWTVVNQYGTDSSNGFVTVAEGEANIGKIDPTDGGWIHMGVYTSVILTAGWYQFDMDMTYTDINDIWGEVYIGASEPVQNVEYSGDQQVIKAYNAWECGGIKTYNGKAVAAGCDDTSPGKFEITTAGTYYLLFRSGGGNFGTSGVTLDNFSLVTTTSPVPEPEPTTGAPVTSYGAVYSLFSDSFASIAPTSWVQGWGSGSVEDFVADSDNIKKYTDLNFQAIDFSSTVDISGYTHIHIDVWTPIDNAVVIKLQDFGPDNTEEYPNADDTEVEVLSTTAQTAETWVGHDIAISDFVGLNTANLGQIQVVIGSATGGTTGTAYIDNIYFYDSTTLGVKDFEIEGLTAYPNPTTDQWFISTKDQVINSIEVYNVLGKRVLSVQPNALSAKVDASSLAPGMYISTITTDLGTASRKLLKN